MYTVEAKSTAIPGLWSLALLCWLLQGGCCLAATAAAHAKEGLLYSLHPKRDATPERQIWQVQAKLHLQ